MVQLHVRIVYDFITCFSNAQAQINIIESDGQFFFKAADLLKDLFSHHHARCCHRTHIHLERCLMQVAASSARQS